MSRNCEEAPEGAPFTFSAAILLIVKREFVGGSIFREP